MSHDLLIWRITLKEPRLHGWAGAVVAAETEEAARHMHPSGGDTEEFPPDELMSGWTIDPDRDVEVTLIGTAAPDVKAGIVFSGFGFHGWWVPRSQGPGECVITIPDKRHVFGPFRDINAAAAWAHVMAAEGTWDVAPLRPPEETKKMRQFLRQSQLK